MNLTPLFTTARVVTAVYRIASTTLLMIYLMKRVRNGRKYNRNDRRRAIRYYPDD
jgi:hypothetical protein